MAAKTASLSVNIIADAAKARAGLKEAETAFGKFRREVGEANGVMGKFGAVGSSVFSAIKANALSFATGAAAAIGTFAVKSVTAFQDLALSAGKFADATGLTSEQASRFIEVAGDLGVELTTIEKAVGFMNKTLGNSPELFSRLGVEIERTASGATDVNATFLNVIDRLNNIEDPAARAAAGTRLLGRNWAELSELVALGADDLSAALSQVSDAKVIDPEEVQRAREFRGAVDDLKDRWEDFSLTIGQALVPALSSALDGVTKLIDGFNKLPGGLEGQARGTLENTKLILEDLRDGADGAWYAMGPLEVILSKLWPTTKRTTEETQFLNQAWKDGYRAQIDAGSASAKLTTEMELQAAAVDAARLEWDTFRTGLNIRQQSLNLQGDIEDFRAKWAGTTDEAKRKSQEYQRELLGIQIGLSNAALGIINLATTAQNTRIRLLIETGQLERAKSLIDAIASGMNMLAGAVTPDRVDRLLGQAGYMGASPPIRSGTTPRTTAPAPRPVAPRPAASYGGRTVSTVRLPRMAEGGLTTASGMALVGEEGPELVNLPRGASVIPSIPSRKMMGGGQTIVNIQVQAGLVSSPDQVGQQIIDAIRRAERRSGQVFASV